jgi:putative aminopeptidase FrvX
MRADSFRFLKALLEAPSPSGYEQPAQKVFRSYIRPYADKVYGDVMGNAFGFMRGKGEKGLTVMLAGHCDEIGFMVKFIDEQGFVYFAAIGGIDDQLLPASRVQIHSQKGAILGVIGRKPIHLIEAKDREKGVKIHDLFIDFGAGSRKEAERTVRIGDPVTFVGSVEKLGSDRIVSRGLDDKVGSFIAAEVVRAIREKKERPLCSLYAVSTVQEEVGLRGATTSAYQIQPDVGLAIEVGHASDYPEIDKKRVGEYRLGAGPIIARGANINPRVYDLLMRSAQKRKLPVQILGAPRATGTDANVIQLSRKGVATGLISIPLRYMHTPAEVLSLKDLDATCELLVAFLYDLQEGMRFLPEP